MRRSIQLAALCAAAGCAGDGCMPRSHILSRCVGLDSTFPGDRGAPDLVDFCKAHCTRDVDGDVTISESDWEGMRELRCVDSISGDLTISRNPRLASLAWLGGLRAVGGDLTIVGNPCLSTDEVRLLLDHAGPDAIAGELIVAGNDGPCAPADP